VPAGPEITVKTGETITIRVSAKGAATYEWTLQGIGDISSPEGSPILYTAAEEGGKAILSVTARNDQGASPPTSLEITVKVSCPQTRAEGTVSPAVAISSITFVVDGAEQTVDDSGSLKASPGNLVEVKEVTICVDSFEGRGGQVYIEFDPVDTDGETVVSEIKGTRAVGVTSGFASVPGPGVPWTIGDWRQLSVVTVHYPPGGGTQNPDCEGGLCEVDDRVIVPIQ